MINFRRLRYLQDGTAKQREAYTVLTEHAIMEKLAMFDPVLTGTIPLNIDIPESDLDIICQWTDRVSFRQTIQENFSAADGFRTCEKVVRENETTIVTFKIQNFTIEVFGQGRPVAEQEAFRHLLIEHQILQEKGEAFRKQIVELKLQGFKTEPAFAKLLGLPCVDPYTELLDLKIDRDFSKA